MSVGREGQERFMNDVVTGVTKRLVEYLEYVLLHQDDWCRSGNEFVNLGNLCAQASVELFSALCERQAINRSVGCVDHVETFLLEPPKPTILFAWLVFEFREHGFHH
jgi:hypothetical protein